MSTVNRNDIINQICTTSGLRGEQLKALRNSLNGMNDAQLNAALRDALSSPDDVGDLFIRGGDNIENPSVDEQSGEDEEMAEIQSEDVDVPVDDKDPEADVSRVQDNSADMYARNAKLNPEEYDEIFLEHMNEANSDNPLFLSHYQKNRYSMGDLLVTEYYDNDILRYENEKYTDPRTQDKFEVNTTYYDNNEVFSESLYINGKMYSNTHYFHTEATESTPEITREEIESGDGTKIINTYEGERQVKQETFIKDANETNIHAIIKYNYIETEFGTNEETFVEREIEPKEGNKYKINEKYEGEVLSSREIIETDKKGNVVKTINIIYMDGVPTIKQITKNGKTDEVTYEKINENGVDYYALKMKKSDGTVVVTKVLDIDDNMDFSEEDFLSRTTTDTKGNVTKVYVGKQKPYEKYDLLIEEKTEYVKGKKNKQVVGRTSTTIYNGISVGEYDDNSLRRVYQKVKSNGQTYEVSYDGKGNTVTSVQNGESIPAIARTFHTNEKAIRRLNAGNLPRGQNFFIVGTQIYVPGEFNADSNELKNRKSAAESIGEYTEEAFRRASEDFCVSKLEDYELNKDYSTTWDLARDICISNGISNPTNNDIATVTNQLCTTGQGNLKKGDKVKIATNIRPDQKSLDALKAAGIQPVPENIGFYQRFHDLEKYQQNWAIDELRNLTAWDKEQTRTTNDLLMDVLNRTGINMFPSGRMINCRDKNSNSYAQGFNTGYNLPIEYYLTEVLNLDISTGEGLDIYNRFLNTKDSDFEVRLGGYLMETTIDGNLIKENYEYAKAHGLNASDVVKSAIGVYYDNNDAQSVQSTINIMNQFKYNESHPHPELEFAANALRGAYNSAVEKENAYYNNHGIFDIGTYAIGLGNVLFSVIPDNILGVNLRSEAEYARDLDNDAYYMNGYNFYTNNLRGFEEQYKRLQAQGYVTKDFDLDAINEFYNYCNNNSNISNEKYEELFKNAFGFTPTQGVDKHISNNRKVEMVGDVGVMVATMGAATEAKFWTKASTASYAYLTGKFSRTGKAIYTATSGMTLGFTYEGIKQIGNNITNPTIPLFSAQTWLNSARAIDASAGFGAAGGIINYKVVQPIVTYIKGGAVPKATVNALRSSQLDGKQLLSSVVKSGQTFNVTNMFKMNASQWAQTGRAALANTVGFAAEVGGFTAYDISTDVLNETLQWVLSGCEKGYEITEDGIGNYLKDKLGEQFTSIGVIKAISHFAMMHTAGKVTEKEMKKMYEDMCNQSEILSKLTFETVKVEGREVYKMTNPNGEKVVFTSVDQAVSYCMKLVEAEYFGRMMGPKEQSQVEPSQAVKQKQKNNRSTRPIQYGPQKRVPQTLADKRKSRESRATQSTEQQPQMPKPLENRARMVDDRPKTENEQPLEPSAPQRYGPVEDVPTTEPPLRENTEATRPVSAEPRGKGSIEDRLVAVGVQPEVINEITEFAKESEANAKFVEKLVNNDMVTYFVGDLIKMAKKSDIHRQLAERIVNEKVLDENGNESLRFNDCDVISQLLNYGERSPEQAKKINEFLDKKVDDGNGKKVPKYDQDTLYSLLQYVNEKTPIDVVENILNRFNNITNLDKNSYHKFREEVSKIDNQELREHLYSILDAKYLTLDNLVAERRVTMPNSELSQEFETRLNQAEKRAGQDYTAQDKVKNLRETLALIENTSENQVYIKEVNRLLDEYAKTGDQNYLINARRLADSVNNVNGVYTNILSPSYESFKHGKTSTFEIAKFLKENGMTIAELTTPEGQAKLNEYLKAHKETPLPKQVLNTICKDFVMDTKYSSVKEYLANNPSSEASKSLYESYLKDVQEAYELSDEQMSLLRKLSDKGVRIMVSSETSELTEALKEVESLYDEVISGSNGEAKLPPVIDFSEARKKWYDSKSAYGQGVAAAFNSRAQNMAQAYSRQSVSTIRHSILHETIHGNDKKANGELRSSVGEALFNTVAPHTENGANSNTVTMENVRNGMLYHDMKALGLSDEQISYAHNNTKEFIAVASEGDLSKCTPRLKAFLLQCGMPEWAFNLSRYSKLNGETVWTAEEVSHLIEADGNTFHARNGQVFRVNGGKETLIGKYQGTLPDVKIKTEAADTKPEDKVVWNSKTSTWERHTLNSETGEYELITEDRYEKIVKNPETNKYELLTYDAAEDRMVKADTETRFEQVYEMDLESGEWIIHPYKFNPETGEFDIPVKETSSEVGDRSGTTVSVQEDAVLPSSAGNDGVESAKKPKTVTQEEIDILKKDGYQISTRADGTKIAYNPVKKESFELGKLETSEATEPNAGSKQETEHIQRQERGANDSQEKVAFSPIEIEQMRVRGEVISIKEDGTVWRFNFATKETSMIGVTLESRAREIIQPTISEERLTELNRIMETSHGTELKTNDRAANEKFKSDYKIVSDAVSEIHEALSKIVNSENFQTRLDQGKIALDQIEKSDMPATEKEVWKRVLTAMLMPKTDLHCHVKANMSRSLVDQLLGESNYSETKKEQVRTALMGNGSFTDLTAFCETYSLFARLVDVPGGIARLVEDNILLAAQNGEVYHEIRNSVVGVKVFKDGKRVVIPPEEVMLETMKGIEAAKAKLGADMPVVSLTIGMNRRVAMKTNYSLDKTIGAVKEYCKKNGINIDIEQELNKPGKYRHDNLLDIIAQLGENEEVHQILDTYIEETGNGSDCLANVYDDVKTVVGEEQLQREISRHDDNVYAALMDVAKNLPNKQMSEALVKRLQDIREGGYQEALDEISQTIDLVQQYRLDPRFSDYVTGVDLNGPETDSSFTAWQEYFDEIVNFNKEHPDMPIGMTIHAGETEFTSLADGSSQLSIEGLTDAVNHGAVRIGHALQVGAFPDQIPLLIEKGITVEVAPTCNIISIPVGVDGFNMHPVNMLAAKGVKTTICTDDPLINATSISPELAKLWNMNYNISGGAGGFEGLVNSGRTGINSAFLSPEQKTSLLKLYDNRVQRVRDLMGY